MSEPSELGILLWFGPEPWGPALDHSEDDRVLTIQVRTPVGVLCDICEEAVKPDDFGEMIVACSGQTVRMQPQHRDCMLLETSGHMVGLCPCTGYEGMSQRQAAIEVAKRLRALTENR